MPRHTLPLIERCPEMPWPAIIEALRVAGISTRCIGSALALSHSTIATWKRGARPNYEDGAAFLVLAWRERDLLPPELAAHCEPRIVDLPPRFRFESHDQPRRSVGREHQHGHAPRPRAEISAAVVVPDEASPWSALDSVTQLWRGACAVPA
ncbi:MAG: hypothetical protein M3N82_02735 [Pseudomonadota bacterium]|nr:hypothetical protein [Pseudomonadota bacterium]